MSHFNDHLFWKYMSIGVLLVVIVCWSLLSNSLFVMWTGVYDMENYVTEYFCGLVLQLLRHHTV